MRVTFRFRSGWGQAPGIVHFVMAGGVELRWIAGPVCGRVA